MYKNLKTLYPGGDLNPGSSVLEADAMTTMPRRRQGIFKFYLFKLIHGIFGLKIHHLGFWV
jgi:hypothetical protein